MGQSIISANKKPLTLYRAEQARAIDAYAIQTLGVNSYSLMRNAAQAALTALLTYWPKPARLVFFCGVGNNGGDGYAMAAMARNRGLTVLVIVVGDTEKLSGDAKTAHLWAMESRCDFISLATITLAPNDVAIDAMLGTGQQAAPRENIAAAVALINASKVPVLAVDVPTGLCADTGSCLGEAAIKANVTVTFIGVKQGLCTNDGPAYAGTLVLDDLDVPAEAIASEYSNTKLAAMSEYQQSLQVRWANSHKGHFGHVLVVGGNHGFGGAALLAARAAGRAGAGLVSVATRAESIGAYLSSQAEIMAHAVSSDEDMAVLVKTASVIVIGPGLGRDDWAKQLLRLSLASKLPLLIDADALNLLAEMDQPVSLANAVLTPHPGEAARLLLSETSIVQADRFKAALALQAKWGGVCVLKGAGTIVAGANSQTVIPTGNAGMAAGGSGDVLSGIIGALMAQKFNPDEAARLGAYVHGLAGDKAAEQGQRGMLASDLIACLREIMNPNEK